MRVEKGRGPVLIAMIWAAGLLGGCETLDLDLEDILRIPSPGTGERVVFRKPGVFLAATRARPYIAFELPVEQGVSYRRSEVDFDLDLGPFQSNLFHGIHTFRGERLFYRWTQRSEIEPPNAEKLTHPRRFLSVSKTGFVFSFRG